MCELPEKCFLIQANCAKPQFSGKKKPQYPRKGGKSNFTMPPSELSQNPYLKIQVAEFADGTMQIDGFH